MKLPGWEESHGAGIAPLLHNHYSRVFSLHVNMLGVTFVICHLYVFFGGGF